jgi:hypothetical protein
MPRNQKKDYSEGPIWDEKVKRWLAEVVYPDDTRGRRRFRRQRDAQIWWAAQRKAIEDGSWEALANPNRVSLGDAIAQYREYSKAHHRSFSTYIENGLTVLGEALGPKTPLKDVTTANIEQMKLQRLENDRVAKSTVDKNVALAKQLVHPSGTDNRESRQEGQALSRRQRARTLPGSRGGVPQTPGGSPERTLVPGADYRAGREHRASAPKHPLPPLGPGRF